MWQNRAMLSAAPGSLLRPAATGIVGARFDVVRTDTCVQLVMAMHGTPEWQRTDDEWIACAAALVRTDAAHEVDAEIRRC